MLSDFIENPQHGKTRGQLDAEIREVVAETRKRTNNQLDRRPGMAQPRPARGEGPAQLTGPDDYPPGCGPGTWTSCPSCGVSIPCTVAGHPYPHTCTEPAKPAGRDNSR
ncbi:hypothetical protein ACL02T_30015 [Pseudonocardia sp. RS010]|uniref:hypothetical protein n=1 Tax=Pseudonocardia sp. RS010 TaxID=3385979 RepID=UPI0039A38DFA